jgi:hypothetical protein
VGRPDDAGRPIQRPTKAIASFAFYLPNSQIIRTFSQKACISSTGDYA